MCDYSDEPAVGLKTQTFDWTPTLYHPQPDTPIICVTANGKIQTFKGIREPWERYVEKWNIVYWDYQSHLLPEIILNNDKD